MSIASKILARRAHLEPAETEDVAVDRDLPMLAEAGVTLLADHWYPADADSKALPIVLLRSPYGRRQLGIVGRVLAERGYRVVIQSCRGTFGSSGVWEPFRHEEADGRTALAWLAEQAWFGGRVATFGPSYLGLTQWAVAGDPPPYVQAMCLIVTASRFRDIVLYPGGSFSLETGAAWLHLLAHQELGWRKVIAAQIASRRGALLPAFTTLPLAMADRAILGQPVEFYQDWLAHEVHGDEWWNPVDFGTNMAPVPPATMVGGWYDIFLPAQIDDFEALRAAGRDAELIVGPWTHASPQVIGTALRTGLAWMDVHLRDRPERKERWPVRLWVMGRDAWVGLPSWPPPAVMQRWHLHGGGRFDRDRPGPSEPDRYRYDPADPTPSVGGASLNAASAGAKDQAVREARADVVTWTSSPLRAATTIAGPLTAEIWLRSSVEHTDVSVRLCRVTRRGHSQNLSDGILRLEPDGTGGIRSAGSAEWGDAERVADGSVRVRIRMWPTAVTLGKGQRVRVQVAGGAHPLFARNPGTGERLGTANRLVSAEHEILHDPDHPSAVELPISSI